MVIQEEMRKGLSKIWKYDVEKFSEPVTLSRSDFEKLGIEAQFEYELTSFEKVKINNEHWFGLYEFFTVPTQHCYCTKDDMYYILGMVKYTKDNQRKTFHTFYSNTNEIAIAYAIEKEYEHMELVYEELFGKKWSGEKDRNVLYNVIDKKYYLGNYFYWYRMYIYNMTYYEMILGLKEGF